VRLELWPHVPRGQGTLAGQQKPQCIDIVVGWSVGRGTGRLFNRFICQGQAHPIVSTQNRTLKGVAPPGPLKRCPSTSALELRVSGSASWKVERRGLFNFESALGSAPSRVPKF